MQWSSSWLCQAMRSLADYRMILYAVVLILVMLFTWSPAFKNRMAMITGKLTRRGREEAQCHD